MVIIIVIFFNNEKVRKYLIENSFVYTIRKPRKTGLDMAVYGNYYKKKLIFTVLIMEINDACKAHLSKFVKHSGFKSKNEWLNAVNEFKTDIKTAKLYKVSKVEK